MSQHYNCYVNLSKTVVSMHVFLIMLIVAKVFDFQTFSVSACSVTMES